MLFIDFGCKFNKSSGISKILIACDIFGLSDAFMSLLGDIKVAEGVIVVSPYKQIQTDFRTEQQAYACFQQNGGIDAYVLSLSELLASHAGIKQVLGFSAGGAALYKALCNLPDNNIQATLFYPSQIRHFLDRHPSSPCHVIFPKSEPHFSLPDVIKVLKKQSKVTVEQNTFQHGFMNKDSQAFNQRAYNQYCQMLKVLYSDN